MKPKTISILGLLLVPAMLLAQSVPESSSGMQTGLLVIKAGAEATVLIDGTAVGDVTAGGFFKQSIVAGEHFVEAIAKVGSCKWNKKVLVLAGMQVAEQVEFSVSCAAGTTSLPLSSAKPQVSSAAEPLAFDPKLKEAQELQTRACLMEDLGRFKDAVELGEKALALWPGIGSECTIGNEAPVSFLHLSLDRAQVASAKEQLAAKGCLSSSTTTPIGTESVSNDKGNKKSKNAKNTPVCDRGPGFVYSYILGDYLAAFASANSLIEGLTRNNRLVPEWYPARWLEERGLAAYATGNIGLALRDIQSAADFYIRESTVRPKESTAEQQNINMRVSLESAEEMHLIRALILGETGDTAQARVECRMGLATEIRARFNLKKYCVNLIGSQSGGANTTIVGSGKPSSDICTKFAVTQQYRAEREADLRRLEAELRDLQGQYQLATQAAQQGQQQQKTM